MAKDSACADLDKMVKEMQALDINNLGVWESIIKRREIEEAKEKCKLVLQSAERICKELKAHSQKKCHHEFVETRSGMACSHCKLIPQRFGY
jgi:tRNA(Ile2) C34 agmatinyltransferase TiaS